MAAEIVALIPVYKRPQRVVPLLRSFADSKAKHARLLFIASPEDFKERKMLQGIDHLVYPHPRSRGDWAKKINYGYEQTTEPWILCGGDDISFRPGWDRALLEAAEKTGKRVLGTQDLNPAANPRGIYSPHPVVARSYADELGTIDGPGAILCELYDHNYPDRELAATAIMRGEWLFVKEAVLEHLHPAWGKADSDPVYKLGFRHANRDGALFRQRRRLWRQKR